MSSLKILTVLIFILLSASVFADSDVPLTTQDSTSTYTFCGNTLTRESKCVCGVRITTTLPKDVSIVQPAIGDVTTASSYVFPPHLSTNIEGGCSDDLLFDPKILSKGIMPDCGQKTACGAGTTGDSNTDYLTLIGNINSNAIAMTKIAYKKVQHNQIKYFTDQIYRYSLQYKNCVCGSGNLDKCILQNLSDLTGDDFEIYYIKLMASDALAGYLASKEIVKSCADDKINAIACEQLEVQYTRLSKLTNWLYAWYGLTIK